MKYYITYACPTLDKQAIVIVFTIIIAADDRNTKSSVILREPRVDKALAKRLTKNYPRKTFIFRFTPGCENAIPRGLHPYLF